MAFFSYAFVVLGRDEVHDQLVRILSGAYFTILVALAWFVRIDALCKLQFVSLGELVLKHDVVAALDDFFHDFFCKLFDARFDQLVLLRLLACPNW